MISGWRCGFQFCRLRAQLICSWVYGRSGQAGSDTYINAIWVRIRVEASKVGGSSTCGVACLVAGETGGRGWLSANNLDRLERVAQIVCKPTSDTKCSTAALMTERGVPPPPSHTPLPLTKTRSFFFAPRQVWDFEGNQKSWVSRFSWIESNGARLYHEYDFDCRSFCSDWKCWLVDWFVTDGIVIVFEHSSVVLPPSHATCFTTFTLTLAEALKMPLRDASDFHYLFAAPPARLLFQGIGKPVDRKWWNEGPPPQSGPLECFRT